MHGGVLGVVFGEQLLWSLVGVLGVYKIGKENFVYGGVQWMRIRRIKIKIKDFAFIYIAFCLRQCTSPHFFNLFYDEVVVYVTTHCLIRVLGIVYNRIPYETSANLKNKHKLLI